MAREIKLAYEFKEGFASILFSNLLTQDCFVLPSRNVVFDRNGILQSFNGFSPVTPYGTNPAGGSKVFALDDGYGLLGTNETTDKGAGTLLQRFGKTLWFVGSGTAKARLPQVNAALQTVGTASSIPQIATLNDAGTGFDAALQVGYAPFTEAPVTDRPATLGTGFTGLFKGSRSFRLAKKRKSGAVSNWSPAGNVVEYNDESGTIEIPEAVAGDGTVEWVVYSPPAGRGVLGDWFELPETILESDLEGGVAWTRTYNSLRMSGTGLDRIVEIEFSDRDLLARTGYYDNFAPTSCIAIFGMNNTMCYVGTFGGNGFSCSKGDQPESIPVNFNSFADESFIGIAGDPNDGLMYLLCHNSIYTAFWSAGGGIELPPVAIRQIFSKTGCLSEKAAVVVGKDLYFLSPERKLMHIDSEGNLDESLYLRVGEALKSLSDDCSMAYDAATRRILILDRDYVLSFCLDVNKFDGISYFEHCNEGSRPTGEAVHAFTQKDRAYFSFWDGTAYKLWTYDEGTDGSNWILHSPFTLTEGGYGLKELDRLFLVYTNVAVPENDEITVEFFTDGELVTPDETITEEVIQGFEITTEHGIRTVKDFTQVAVKLSGSGYMQSIHALNIEGKVHGIKKK